MRAHIRQTRAENRANNELFVPSIGIEPTTPALGELLSPFQLRIVDAEKREQSSTSFVPRQDPHIDRNIEEKEDVLVLARQYYLDRHTIFPTAGALIHT
ncbi:hypothetical protein [Trueperella pyogenes]|uniref:hypothetical protein n=1 Tax=Trueperella pyogenes TaxID=1661 RepID=UPI00345CCAD4